MSPCSNRGLRAEGSLLGLLVLAGLACAPAPGQEGLQGPGRPSPAAEERSPGNAVTGPETQPGPQLRVPLAVRSFSDRPYPPLPVWTGVPLPRSAVAKVDSLRLLGPDGKPVPAQFDVLAKWADGSIKWVLLSFLAAKPVMGRAGPEWSELAYTLASQASLESPAPDTPLELRPDTNDTSITTGPLQFRLNRHSFHGISQAWLDLSGDGQFENAELIAPETDGSGIVAVDDHGKLYTSGNGTVRSMELERRGPVHAVVAVHGDLRPADSDPGGPGLLEYAMRIHAFAGCSALRVVLTVHNPRPCGRAEDGSRWVLGQSGAVLLKSLEYVQPVRFAQGLRRVTLSPEPGRIFDRIPLVPEVPHRDQSPEGSLPWQGQPGLEARSSAFAALGPPVRPPGSPSVMRIYQDSSGGENWFHRTHVDKDNVIPLSFRGYRCSYRGRQIHEGLRASPWVEVADGQWAVAMAAPAFWENFPKSLAVDADGTLRLGLWPERPGGAHEIQGGEQKTHEFWLYFRHRRGADRSAPTGRARGAASTMPLARELMPTCLARPVVWASAEAYAAANITDPILPAGNARFANYEAAVAAAVRDGDNLFTQREEVDEYGWRNFGDTWAANEADRTEGPYSGLRVVSHYNNEYDLGFGMLQQAMRTVEADPAMARAWWKLGTEALWHEADIDIYHTRRDPAPIYNGGTFTHTAHGVEAARSTHRGAPRDEVWGALDWPWHRGSTPESGHFRNRGILLAYLLSGDRHLLEAANDVRDLVAFKVENDRFAQITSPDRSCGNNVQVLLDAYLLEGEERYLKLAEKAAAAASFDAVTKATGRSPGGGDAWQYALYLKSLYRLIQAKAERGMRDEAAIESFLKYARALYDRSYGRRGRRREGSWSLLSCEMMMQAAELSGDQAEREKFIRAAQDAFVGIDYLVREGSGGQPSGPARLAEAGGPSSQPAVGLVGRFINSKTTTMLLQGGGMYMRWAIAKEAPSGDPPAEAPPRDLSAQ